MMCMGYYCVAISVVLPLCLDPLPRTVHVTALLSTWLGGGGWGGGELRCHMSGPWRY
jgi:hypothetical protein